MTTCQQTGIQNPHRTIVIKKNQEHGGKIAAKQIFLFTLMSPIQTDML